MTTTTPHEETASPAGTTPSRAPSLFGRAIRIYSNPAQAWAGLETRVQWWFPVLVVMAMAILVAVALHERATLPTIYDAMDRQSADGQMTAEQVAQAEKFWAGTTGYVFSIVQQSVVAIVMPLLTGLLVWFSTGFVLGTRIRYRLALEVAAWSGLITIPTYLISAVLAWNKQSFQNIHAGFGMLLPESDHPSKLMSGLAALLDGIGPLSIWWLVVLVIGASTVSGAPRKAVAWSLGALYLTLMVFFALIAALMTPGS